MRQSHPLSSPVLGHHPSSSPVDGHDLLELPMRQPCPLSSPADGHCPLPMLGASRCPSTHGHDSLILDIDENVCGLADDLASEHSAEDDDLLSCHDRDELPDDLRLRCGR